MELTLNVNIVAPNLCEALLKLANVLKPDDCGEKPTQTAQIAPETLPAAEKVQMSAPIQKPAETQVQPAETEQSIKPESQPVELPAPSVAQEVEAPAYTLEQLSRAGAALATSGKMPELMALMQKHGVQALTQLKPDQYPAMADDLRSMGAQI